MGWKCKNNFWIFITICLYTWVNLICLICLITFLKFFWWLIWTFCTQNFLKWIILSSLVCVLLSIQLYSKNTSVSASVSEKGGDVYKKKQQYKGGDYLKRWAWIVCRFKRGFYEKEGDCVFEEGFIPNAHYGREIPKWDFLWPFHTSFSNPSQMLHCERYFSYHPNRWREKYLLKCSLIKHTCSWCDKLIMNTEQTSENIVMPIQHRFCLNSLLTFSFHLICWIMLKVGENLFAKINTWEVALVNIFYFGVEREWVGKNSKNKKPGVRMFI